MVNQRKAQNEKKRVPKGTSSYQAAWILEDDAEGESLHSEDVDEEAEMMPEYEQDLEDRSNEEEEEEFEEVDMDNRSVKFDVLDDEENANQYIISALYISDLVNID